MNEFDAEAELDYALENRSTYSMNDSESKSDHDSEEESVNSYTSYDSESQSDAESEEDSDNNSDLISPSFYQEDEDENDESSKMERFDDEALIEFIKKEQKFISIDLMIQMEFCSGSTLQQHLEEPGRVINRQENFSFFKQLL